MSCLSLTELPSAEIIELQAIRNMLQDEQRVRTDLLHAVPGATIGAYQTAMVVACEVLREGGDYAAALGAAVRYVRFVENVR